MLANQLSLFLNLLIIWLIITALTAFTINAFRHLLLNKVTEYPLGQRKKLLWGLALFPYVFAAFLVFLIMLPSFKFALSACADCHIHVNSYEHLCWYHPMSFSFISIKAFFLYGVAAYVSFLSIRFFYHIVQSLTFINKIKSAVSHQQQDVNIVKCDFPIAATIGLWSPKIFISQYLLDNLSTSYQKIVINHERMHLKNKDPLKNMLFRALCFIFPSSMFIEKMNLTVEQTIDEAISNNIDKTDTASAIINVARLNLFNRQYRPPIFSSHFSDSIIESRVNQLLCEKPSKILPSQRIIWGAALVLTLALLTDELSHKLIEKLIHFLTVYL